MDTHIPNDETIKAMEDTDAGKDLAGPFKTVDELLEELGQDDYNAAYERII